MAYLLLASTSNGMLTIRHYFCDNTTLHDLGSQHESGSINRFTNVFSCSSETCVNFTPQNRNPLKGNQSQSHIVTDGQSVSQSRCRAPPGAYDQIFITVWQLWSCFCEAPSVTRGRVCLLYMLPAQSFSGPSPLGLETIFYCLRFETSHFVASYDSQGHGGGIRPRLHTGYS
jgi:hypothetical protein